MLNEYSNIAKAIGKLHENYLELAYKECSKQNDCDV